MMSVFGAAIPEKSVVIACAGAMSSLSPVMSSLVGTCSRDTCPGDEQLRFGDGRQERCIATCDRQGHADQFVHAGVGGAGPQSNYRAERIAGDRYNRNCQPAKHERHCPLDVIHLGVAIVVRAGAASDATKIEAQCGVSCILECVRERGDDIVVHVAAIERVRVANDDANLRRGGW